MPSEHEHRLLQHLLDREAIRDCLYRYSRGIDRIDEEALRSCYWPDASCRHGAHEGSGAEFVEFALEGRRSAGRAIHMIGNILIELRGDVAAVESYFRTTLEGRGPDGRPQETLLAGRYVDRFERRAAEWRVAARTVVYDWVRQLPLPAPMAQDSFGSRLPTGACKPYDPVYGLLASLQCAP
jgi:ketosteroid isomerase-like protein